MSNGPSPQQVTVRVPGSTSNCGAGFDSLGLALSVYNRVTLRREDAPPAATNGGWVPRPERESDSRAQAMVTEAAKALGTLARIEGFGFSYRIEGDVPPARGLGSSITVIGGVLAGLTVLSGSPLDREQLVAIATHLEGHPDNAAAGLLGGFCVARCDPAKNDYLGTIRITLPNTLRFVVTSPSVELLTKESRGVLPSQLTRTVTRPTGWAGLSRCCVKSLSQAARRKRGSSGLTWISWRAGISLRSK